jgi:hypothetical protein
MLHHIASNDSNATAIFWTIAANDLLLDVTEEEKS